ncbi:MAG: efflux RND transporter periplasmic adaptor subunit [candidate division KSB1 bacterium]|nr:efflux RND transporter periplasmic adaptor subunit [candidate division KSB1 bacterium]
MKTQTFILITTLAFLLISCGKEVEKPTTKIIAMEHQHGESHEAAMTKEKKVAEKEQEGKTLYHCPMHPSYISDKPGNCPICGMKLVPMEEAKKEAEAAGPVPVTITPETQALTGVQTEAVAYRDLEKVIRTVGKLTYDERKLAYVTTKIEGWIEELFVDYTGKLVEKGQPLFTLYSPELVSTQEEYLLALKAQKYLAKNPFDDVASGANTLLEATKRRLLLWDIPEKAITELERTGKPSKTLTIYSPIKGYVIEKMALQGMKVMPGMNLYQIADLSTVWVYADIYEYEFPFVNVGQEASVSLPYYPDETFTGRVSYIFPYLEPQTRTVKVRLEFPNPTGKLKPEMFADVELKGHLGKKLAIPKDAILDTGLRKMVWVALGDGNFMGKEVEVGAEAISLLGSKKEKFYPVIKGLAEGERVVTKANFLIDSQSQISAVVAAAYGGALGEKPSKPPAHQH